MTPSPQVRAGVYGRQSRNKAKSITEQVNICTADVHQQGWQLAEVYQDGTSASRHARKQRDDWPRVLKDIAAGKLDVLVLWESSRGDRKLTTWSALLDLCREKRVLIRITDHDTTYDVRKRADWERLASEGISNASDSEKISAGVRRGQAGAAAAGRPSHGRAPYGYRRKYDPNTGQLLGQEPDPDIAPVPVGIIRSVAANIPVSRITQQLNTDNVPTIDGATRWYEQRVRDIATNVAYLGLRSYRGQTYPGSWPPIAPDIHGDFYTAQRILSDPARVTTRPGRYKHLLSYLATCTECDGLLCAVKGKYRCWRKSCVSIAQDETDEFVTRMILGRLSRPDLYEGFRQAGEEVDREVLEARAEAARLRGLLDQWRASAARGETSPESLAAVETGLTAQIRAADLKVARTAVPVALRQVLEPGTDVATRWESIPLPSRREVIRELAVVRLGPADRPGRRTFDPSRLGTSQWVGDDITWSHHWGQGREG